MTKKIKDMTPKELQQYYEKKTTQAYNKAAKRMIKVLNSKLDENTDWYSLKPSEFEHHMAMVFDNYNLQDSNVSTDMSTQATEGNQSSQDKYVKLTAEQLGVLNAMTITAYGELDDFNELSDKKATALIEFVNAAVNFYKQSYPDAKPSVQ